jgi:hypothetical protein
MYDLDADPAYRDIPKRIMDGMMRWGNHGYHPGGFLTAVLKGDLLDAVCLADDETITHLRSIVKFVYNQMPAGCHALSAPSICSSIMGHWQARFEPGPNL